MGEQEGEGESGGGERIGSKFFVLVSEKIK